MVSFLGETFIAVRNFPVFGIVGTRSDNAANISRLSVNRAVTQVQSGTNVIDGTPMVG